MLESSSSARACKEEEVATQESDAETFIAENGLSGTAAAERLRSSPPDIQSGVVERGVIRASMEKEDGENVHPEDALEWLIEKVKKMFAEQREAPGERSMSKEASSNGDESEIVAEEEEISEGEGKEGRLRRT